MVSFSAAAYHLHYRDQFIGWSPQQRRRRPSLIVNQARFLILPGAHYSNLASRLLTSAAHTRTRAFVGRLAGALGAPGRAGRDFRRSGVLPRHHLQGQRLERTGPDLGVRPARARFLRTAGAAEATLGEATRQRRLPATARAATAGGRARSASCARACVAADARRRKRVS